MFTLATWNINSVRLREGLVARLLRDEAPDILCLQETKTINDSFPMEAFEALPPGVVQCLSGTGPVGKASLHMRTPEGWSRRQLFDATPPVLDELRPEPAFSL